MFIFEEEEEEEETYFSGKNIVLHQYSHIICNIYYFYKYIAIYIYIYIYIYISVTYCKTGNVLGTYCITKLLGLAS